MPNINFSQKRFVTLGALSAALTLFLLKAFFALNNPFFIGDSGFRMSHAAAPIFRVGNRWWLPFLQAHIWIFYKLQLPFYVFKLIPCFYFFLALLFLMKLTYKIIGKNYSVFFFLLLLMFGFAYQQELLFLSVNLYQEILEIALFYMLLYMGALNLRKSKSLLIIAAFALLTRDTFWIYLLVITVYNYKKIISDKTYIYAFIFLWLIPVLWISAIPFVYLIKFSRWPHWPLEWPLMINKPFPAVSNPLESFGSICVSIIKSRVVFIFAGAAIAYAAGVLYFRNKRKELLQKDSFDNKFKVFSFASLAVIYCLVLLFNPWYYIYGHKRIAIPLLSHLFIWMILFYKETFDYPKITKILIRFVLAVSILLAISFRASDWTVKDYSYLMNAYSQISKLRNNTCRDCRLTACAVGNDYWQILDGFAAPALYMKQKFFKIEEKIKIDECDIVAIPSDLKFDAKLFSKYMELKIKGYPYMIYKRDYVATCGKDF